MVYIKQDWEDDLAGGTPLSGVRLRHLETQYDEAVEYVDDKVPPGGTAGQALVKDVLGDNVWGSAVATVDPAEIEDAVDAYLIANPIQAVPNGGSTGQALVKTSGVDGAIGWGNVAVADASDTVKGAVELATNSEVQTGTDTARAVTPAGLAALTATTSRRGVVELATDAETQTGTDVDRAVTPAGLAARTATETRAGVVELATTAEATTGSDTARAVTPAGVKTVVDARVNVVAVRWNGSTWGTYTTDSTVTRMFFSQNDVTADDPTYYSAYDTWFRHPEA